MSTAVQAPAPQTIVTHFIDVGFVIPSPTNPRKAFDPAKLEEMTLSVRKHGVIQPVLLRPWPSSRKAPKGVAAFADRAPDGVCYELVCGERRLRATKAAGGNKIPALVRDMTDAEVLEIQLVENLQRSDLHPLEEAEGYRQLVAAKYDVARIAERVGRSPKYVYDRIKLLDLTKEAQQAFLEGEFTAGHAVILARLKPADQKRAMDTAPRDGLFRTEGYLFTPEEEKGLPGRFELRKPCSVRELQAWVDRHTKLEAEDTDPVLFPETADVLRAAAQQDAKVVRVTYNETTPEEILNDGTVILGRSWKRADGQHGSKACPRSVIGMVVIGPGRGQAFNVCINKKNCEVHWGDLIKAAKKREKAVAKSGAKTGEDREAIRRKQAKAEEEVRRLEAARWENAGPEIAAALAGALKKAPAGADGAVGKLVLESFEDSCVWGQKATAAKLLPSGRSAEDLVRNMALQLLLVDLESSDDRAAMTKTAKTFGVDILKILDRASPLLARCRECACTEANACVVRGVGCSWVEKPDPKTKLGLCSACEPAATPAAKKAARKKR